RPHAGRGGGPVHEPRARGDRVDCDRRARQGRRAVTRGRELDDQLPGEPEHHAPVLQPDPDRAARWRGGSRGPAAAIDVSNRRAQSQVRDAAAGGAVLRTIPGRPRPGLHHAARLSPGGGVARIPRGHGAGMSADGGNTAYRVTLPEFEGPLDLLLHLCKTHELDIVNIPIAVITRKYLEYLELMQSMSVDVAADYLVMAATLAYLKSREL